LPVKPENLQPTAYLIAAICALDWLLSYQDASIFFWDSTYTTNQILLWVAAALWIFGFFVVSVPKADFTYINGVEKKDQNWAWKSEKVQTFCKETFSNSFSGGAHLSDGTYAKWTVEYQWSYGTGLDNTLHMINHQRTEFVKTLYTSMLNSVLVEGCKDKATALSSFLPAMTNMFATYPHDRANDEAGVSINLMAVTQFGVDGNPTKLPTTYSEAMVREAMKRAEILRGMDEHQKAEQVIKILKDTLVNKPSE
jgi:hypothetical protein